MGDFSNYAEQGLVFGKTVEYEVTELVNADGSHPIVHLEHIGAANATLLEEVIAGAGADAETTPKSILDKFRANQEYMIKHSVRRIERVFFSDGTPATDADIPGFVRSLPIRAFDRMQAYAMTERNFYKHTIATDPQALAEK